MFFIGCLKILVSAASLSQPPSLCFPVFASQSLPRRRLRRLPSVLVNAKKSVAAISPARQSALIWGEGRAADRAEAEPIATEMGEPQKGKPAITRKGGLKPR